jgi:hypothetical protein
MSFIDHLGEAQRLAGNRVGTSSGDFNTAGVEVSLPLWVVYGLINEIEMLRRDENGQSFRDIKQEIKNGPSV